MKTTIKPALPRKMTYKRAVQVATAAMKEQIQKHAVEANLQEKWKLDTAYGRTAVKLRADLRAAIDLLQQSLQVIDPNWKGHGEK